MVLSTLGKIGLVWFGLRSMHERGVLVGKYLILNEDIWDGPEMQTENRKGIWAQ